MPFDAKVYRILIASPGDLDEERNAIPEIIAEWNHINSVHKQAVLLPVRWETHSAPAVGDRPQGIINDQLAKACDMVVGLFWTRLGSPTGVSESGTVEEIQSFIDAGKPVMLYFSGRAVDPQTIDISQFQSVRDFQKKMQKVGLMGAYQNLQDFREKLFRQLSLNVDNLISGESIASPSLKSSTEKAEVIKSLIRPDGPYIEDYAKDGVVRSILVKGDTRSLKEELKALGGRWNRSLGGWIFPKTKDLAVAECVKAGGTD